MKYQNGKLCRWLFIIFLFVPILTQAQYRTQKHVRGNWNSGKVWHDQYRPGFDIVSGNTVINGTITSDDNIIVREGSLTVEDTLIIRANLILRRGAALNISEGGVLIVYGNVLFFNKNTINLNGTMIIERNLTAYGIRSNMYFAENGKLFVIGRIRKGSRRNLPQLNCNGYNYPDACVWGRLQHLQQDPIYEYYKSGGFELISDSEYVFCRDESTNLAVLDANHYIVRWFHDGIQLQGENDSFLNISTPGEYYANVVSFTKVYKTRTVTIDEINIPNISLEDQSVCYNDSLVIDAGSNYKNYSWSNGDSTSTLSVLVTQNASYSLIVRDQYGCEGYSDTFNVNVLELPSVSFDMDTSLCFGQNVTVDAGSEFTQYAWNTGQTSQTILVEELGEHQYYVRITNNNGCSNTSDTALITIHSLPTVNLNIDTSFCHGNHIELDAGNSFLSYQWSNNDTTQRIDITEIGSYELFVTVSDVNSCVNISDTAIINIHELPFVQFGVDTSICYGNTVQFDAGSGFISYAWNNGDTTQVFEVKDVGSENVFVQVIDNNGCTNISDTATVVVNALPEVGFDTDTSFCFGTQIDLDAGVFKGYRWSNGDTTRSVNINEAGNHQISVHITDENSCSNSSDTAKINIHELPEVKLNVDTSICYGTTVQIDAGAGYITYSWNNGNSTQIVDVSNVGTENVFVQVTDINGCENISDTATVVVFHIPSINIGNDTSLCSMDSIVLDAGVNLSNYAWNTGDTTQYIEVYAENQSNYSVSAINEFGCIGFSDTITINVYNLPQVELGKDTTVCHGEVINLDAGENFTSYSWNDNQSTQIIYISEVGSETYYVDVVDTNGCFGSSDTIAVQINPKPVAGINGLDTICNGQQIELIAIGGSTYLWNSGDTINKISVHPAENTQYEAYVTNEFNCSDTATHSIFVKPGFDLSITGDSLACAGNSLSLSIPDGNNIHWNTGDTLSTISVALMNDTVIVVSASNDVGCYDTAFMNISILPQPVANIEGDQELCPGEQTILTATGGDLFVWSTGAATSSIQTDGNDTLHYWVSVTNTSGCSDTATAELNLLSKPNGLISGNLSICPGMSTTLSASGGVQFLWNNGSVSSTISVIPDETSDYYVVVTDTNSCKDTAYVTVVVSNPDIAIIEGPISLCSGVDTVLIASGGESFEWLTGNTSNTLEINPDTTSNYWVVVTDSNGCFDTAFHKVSVSSYDNYECPKLLGTIGNWKSIPGEYTTIFATPDGDKPSCFSSEINRNIWFAFIIDEQINSITIRTGGKYGSMKGQRAYLMDADGSRISCIESPMDYQGALILSIANLQVGESYFLMVDDRSGSGSFSLEFSSLPFNDDIGNAYIITNPSNWNSGTMQFTTVDATRDGDRLSCTGSRPNNDVWFKFKAETNKISVRLNTANNYGTLADPAIMLINEDNDQLACNYANGAEPTMLAYKNLVIGDWYYVSVSNVNDLPGSFTLSTNSNTNPGNIYYAISDGSWHSDIWSVNPEAESGDGITPAQGDIVYILDHHVTLESDAEAYSVYITLGSNSSLILEPNVKIDLENRMYINND